MDDRRLLLIFNSLFFIIISSSIPRPVVSISWMALPSLWESQSVWNWTSLNLTSESAVQLSSAQHQIKSACWLAVRHKVFNRQQAKLCQQQPILMQSVREAAQSAAVACQNAFSERRWNCSSLSLLPRKTPDLNRGTREQAWIYALSSASLTRSVARGCSSGLFKQCGCGSFPRHPPDGQFKWGGCGDDVIYGKKLAKTFTDAKLKGLGRLKTISSNLLRIADHTDPITPSGTLVHPWKLPHVMAAVNMHNNRVGRKVIEQSLMTQCKCHGVSGSCQVKTCWRSLPHIGDIAERMKRLYGMAVEVVPRRPSDMRRSVAAGPTTTLTALYHHGPSMMASSAVRDGGFNEHDLIYVTKSPDYCRRDRSSGSLGTVGRTCNASTAAHGGSCNSLCCGRGYVTSHREQVERCYCKYIWCCTVECQTCRRKVEVHTCK